MVDRIGTLHLRRVVSVGAGGAVALAGTNARVLSAGALSPEHVGRIAICQDASDDSEAITMILGLAARDNCAENDIDAPTVIGTGSASISLYPDGHIRMEGSDVTVDSSGKLRLLAGRIDLN